MQHTVFFTFLKAWVVENILWKLSEERSADVGRVNPASGIEFAQGFNVLELMNEPAFIIKCLY